LEEMKSANSSELINVDTVAEKVLLELMSVNS
jgi:hypothetical protein